MISMASYHLKGALGVVDVDIQPRRWPPFWLRLPTSSNSSSNADGDSSSLRIARRWGLALEVSADGAGAIEVAWSKAPGVRAGDVLLAVDGQAVAGRPLAAVEKLLLAALEPANADDKGSMDSKGLQLMLDTTKGWGVSSSGRQRQRLHQGWGRFACRWVLDGYDRLLDARCCPQRKLPLHILALTLLFSVVESAFQSATALSDKHGPLLLLPHAHLLAFERIWSVGFAIAALGLGLGCALVRRPRLGATLVGTSALLLHCLLVALLLIPAVAGLTLLISGFVLLPPGAEAAVEASGSEAAATAAVAIDEEAWDLEGELRGLLTHVLCAIVLPLLACACLRRLASFCDGYAALLASGKNPKLLGLTMPLSAHFAAPEGEERERFLALRSCGY